MVDWFLIRAPGPFNGERIAFSEDGVGTTTGWAMCKISKLDPYITLYVKFTQNGSRT